MKLKEVSLGKEFKCGLPNFSNLTVRADMKWELEEGETMDWDEAWDMVNRQLTLQTDGLDPEWISKREYSRYFKVIVKATKSGDLQNRKVVENENGVEKSNI